MLLCVDSRSRKWEAGRGRAPLAAWVCAGGRKVEGSAEELTAGTQCRGGGLRLRITGGVSIAAEASNQASRGGLVHVLVYTGTA